MPNKAGRNVMPRNHLTTAINNLLENYRLSCLFLSLVFVCFIVSCDDSGHTSKPNPNPTPTLSSLRPSMEHIGEPGFTLTVIGSNFVSSSIVQWNGSDRPTRFIGGTQLEADIPAGDITSAGIAEVSVFTPSPGGGFSNTIDFIIIDEEPVISLLSPAGRTMGDPDFTLTVDGYNFLPSSIIRWDGFDCPTTFVSSTQLTTAIPAQAVATAGSAEVLVHNSLVNGGDSDKVRFAIDNNIEGWAFLGAPTINGKSYPGVEQIVVDQGDQQILYVTVNRKGLFTSRDGGYSWEEALGGTAAGCIAPDPNTVDRIFYGQQNLLYESTDRGLSWHLRATLDSGAYFISMIVSQIDPHTIYAGLSGANGFFYRSLDDGLTWETYSFGETVGLDNFIPWTIAEDPVDGTLYVGVELGRHPDPYHPPLLRSFDGGVTWTNLVESVTSSDLGPTWHVVKAVVHPTNHTLYALTEGPGLYISEDHGETWTRWVNAPDPVCELIIDQNWPDRLFGGQMFYSTMPGGTFVSTCGGHGFLPFGLGGLTTCSLESTEDSSHLYAASYGSGIYVTPLSDPDPIPEPIPEPPLLISPNDGDVISQPYDGQTFEWQSVPGAQGYQIIVTHPYASTPAINAKTISTHYRYIEEGTYTLTIYDWTWKVRAQNSDGVWGPWSEIGTFSVTPKQ